jgi:amidase
MTSIDDALSADTSAIDTAAAVRDGRTTAVEAVTESLARIEARDPAVHAFQVVRHDKALAEAAAFDGDPSHLSLPLAGVPIAIKDNVPVAGEPMRVGSAATSDEPQAADHPVVARIRAAGAIVVGLTAVPELCVFGATDSVYGITRNPWSPSRTPGGSSGGSAAAVAAGMVPIAHGNDGMGSVRIPAGCCGLVGIKPGTGLVPVELGATDWYGLSENGALGTTVADVALLLSVMAAEPALADVSEPDRPLRFAASITSPVQGVVVDREHARAAYATAGLLMREGHTAERVTLPSPQTAAIAGLARWFAGAAADADLLDETKLEPRIRQHAALGRKVRTSPLFKEEWREGWKQTAAAFFAEHDVLITPTLATPPIEAKAWGQGSWKASMQANIRYAPFAAPWNIAGFPAIAVPAGVHPTAGTPLSVQLVAAPGGEALLLGVAALLERLRPWRRIAPGYR